jgi:hypothetical protein
VKPNKALPPLWILKARSLLALLLTLAQIAAISLGFEASTLTSAGAGVGHMLDGVQLVLPACTALWAYVERVAPNFRLTLARPRG